MYAINYSFESLDDLQFFRKREQQEIMDTIDAQLHYEPTVETRNRKELRPNEVGPGSCGSAASACSTMSMRKIGV